MQNTSTPGGELVFHMMGALAQFERKLISERTRAGMAAAKARGSLVGRPRRLSNVDADQAKEWIANDMAKREVARRLKVSTATLYRHLKRSQLLAS
jgi:DNA invertase Pin-like site-specific DNA recombinase